MEFLEKLNASQKRAALWNQGPLLVLAGPGSGKTATLTSRVARLVQASEDESFRILCLTFTRKAATEMRERVLRLVPDARSRVLLTTFHSFATDIVRQHGSHLGFSPDFEIIEEPERINLVKNILASNGDELNRILSAEKALSALDFMFSNLIEDSGVAGLVKDPDFGRQLQVLFMAYKSLLKHENCLDYSGILYFCEELIRTRPRLAKQLGTVYRYICVDEFQDTNVAQYRLLRALAPDRDSNVFIVGDDDQVIYQWNGASPARINELGAHYDLTTIQLPENYRCPAAVVELANSLISHNDDRAKGKQPLRSMKVATQTSPVALHEFADQEDEAAWVAANISDLIQSGTSARDVVVLARNSKLLGSVHQALSKKSIRAHIQKRKSQFESAPLRFVTSTLKLAAVRTDEELASIVTKALSDCIDQDVMAEELLALSGQANGDHIAALGLLFQDNKSISREIREAIENLLSGKYQEFVKQTLRYFDLVEAQSQKGEEIFADYPSERQVWRSIVEDLGGEDEAYAMPLGQFLQELALANKTPEAPSNAVRCLTIHASKGMEFTNVYLIGLAEDQLPSFQSKKAGDKSRELQEERRNCFVAITRSIESLTLTYAKRYNGWSKAPSRFLFEMGLLSSTTTKNG